MVQISVRMDEDSVEELDSDAEDRDLSRAEFVRELIESRNDTSDLQDELDDCHSELQESRARVNELRQELAAANRRIDDANDLIETSREMVQVQETERNLQARRAGAGIWTRFKWWMTGDPVARELGQETGRDDPD